MNTDPSPPCYLLKLHRDARPERGRWRGRLVDMRTGRHVDFDSAEALLRGLGAVPAAPPPPARRG